MINERLKELRKNLNMTQEELADMAKVKRTTYLGYEKGSSLPSSDFLKNLNKKLKINLNWLVNGSGKIFVENSTLDLESTNNLPKESGAKIPLLRQNVSCGPGQEWQDADVIEEYIEPIASFPSAKDIVPYAFKVRGFSMVGAGIMDGDIVIFNGKPNQLLLDDIYVFALDGLVYCKLLKFDAISKTIKIFSLHNDDLKKAELLKELNDTDPNTTVMFKLFGRVVGWIHENRLLCR